MITLKLKYENSDPEYLEYISKVQKQYNHVFNVAYNFIFENNTLSKFKLEKKDSELKIIISHLNDIDTLDYYNIQCAIDDAYTVANTNNNDKKIIFGGKKLFFDRMYNRITKEEFKEKRLRSFYSIGRSNLSGNMKFKFISPTLICFQNNRYKKYNLTLLGIGNRKKILEKLYELAHQNIASITYRLNKDTIWITYDETFFKKEVSYDAIKNRIFAIDMNPNYVGWSITDWINSNTFNVIKRGVFSIKEINDIETKLKKKKLSSTSIKRKHLNNERQYKTLLISKQLTKIARYYKCELFGIEDLNICSKDNKKGNNYNKLINNLWCRNSLVNNLQKRCNILDIHFLKVIPNYSSFIGNFLFRNLKLPDMVLSSIEISRRTYEFNGQYINKEIKKQKNIVIPNWMDFKNTIIKSLEEFNMNAKFADLKEIYYFLKKSKISYRFPLDDLKFFRLNSINGIYQLLFNKINKNIPVKLI